MNLRPTDSELARRAAGGDGTAFVRLYDRYAADVFEGVLAATASVDLAADATQSAFLTLLRHPPAIDAPDAEVIDRLRAMALTADPGWRAPIGAGVGWLRSETVAKAGARYNADWSVHLAGMGMTKRTPADVALGWQPPAAPEPPARLPRPPALALPPPVARFRLRSGLPALAVAAVLALVLLTTGGDDETAGESSQTPAIPTAARLAPLGAMAGPPEQPPKRRTSAAARDSAPAEEVALVSEETPVDDDPADSTLAASTDGQAPATDGPAPARGEALGVKPQTTAPRGDERLSPQATVPEPTSPSRPPAASPAPVEPEPGETAPDAGR